MVVDEIQAGVSAWLHRSVEEPPHNVDVDAILATEKMRGGTMRSGRRVVMMLAVSAVVAAVAVGIS